MPPFIFIISSLCYQMQCKNTNCKARQENKILKQTYSYVHLKTAHFLFVLTSLCTCLIFIKRDLISRVTRSIHFIREIKKYM